MQDSGEESGGGMAEALTKVQLKKPTEAPQDRPPTGNGLYDPDGLRHAGAVGMDTDLALLAASVMGAASAESTHFPTMPTELLS